MGTPKLAWELRSDFALTFDSCFAWRSASSRACAVVSCSCAAPKTCACASFSVAESRVFASVSFTFDVSISLTFALTCHRPVQGTVPTGRQRPEP
jgi:hypothetical protein